MQHFCHGPTDQKSPLALALIWEALFLPILASSVCKKYVLALPICPDFGLLTPASNLESNYHKTETFHLHKCPTKRNLGRAISYTFFEAQTQQILKSKGGSKKRQGIVLWLMLLGNSLSICAGFSKLKRRWATKTRCSCESAFYGSFQHQWHSSQDEDDKATLNIRNPRITGKRYLGRCFVVKLDLNWSFWCCI